MFATTPYDTKFTYSIIPTYKNFNPLRKFEGQFDQETSLRGNFESWNVSNSSYVLTKSTYEAETSYLELAKYQNMFLTLGSKWTQNSDHSKFMESLRNFEWFTHIITDDKKYHWSHLLPKKRVVESMNGGFRS